MIITNHKNDGVKLKFNNGVVLSTIWGCCTYSDNHDVKSDDNGFGKHKNGSKNIEFMFLEGDDKLIRRMCKKYGNDENPSGYIPVEDWLEMVLALRRLDKTKEKQL